MSMPILRRILLRIQFSRSVLSAGHGEFFTSGFVSKDRLMLFYTRNLQIRSEGSSIVFSRRFCACSQQRNIGAESSSRDILLKRLEYLLRDHQVGDAWEVFNDFRKLHGYPDQSVMCKLITEMSYSVESRWLRMAYDLVSGILKSKTYLLKQDVLAKLSISLARAQLPTHATTILRQLHDKRSLLIVLSSVVLHLVRTGEGTVLASNLLVEICNCCGPVSNDNPGSKTDLKPDTSIFNLVLDACVRFECCIKGQQIIEVMARRGVVADAQSLIIIAKIHEMSGQRDELLKYKDLIHPVPMSLLNHYQSFYDSLLSLHFKYGDLDASSNLAIEMYKMQEDVPVIKAKKGRQKPCLVPIVSQNLKSGLKIQVLPDTLLKDTVLKLPTDHQFTSYRNGKLFLSNRSIAKLIHGYKQSGRINELSKVVTKIDKELGLLKYTSFCSDVLNACLFLGWLDTAHDIIDDMELAGNPMPDEAYKSLMSAYCKKKMLREAMGLIHQMRKAGFKCDSTDEQLVSTCLTDDNTQYSHQRSCLGESLVREAQQEIPSLSALYKLNSSIYFFCKAKMMEDAVRSYKRMQAIHIQPTVQTFTSLLQGYASLGMYREMTIVWGDIKRSLEGGSLPPNRDVFEFLLSNFIQGGYFKLVMDIIIYMKKQNMFIDKWVHKDEFLKLHKDLYKNLKAPTTRTEAQRKRLNFVQEFRKWACIN